MVMSSQQELEGLEPGAGTLRLVELRFRRCSFNPIVQGKSGDTRPLSPQGND